MNNVKVKDMQYTRVDMEKVVEQIEGIAKAIANAQNVEEILKKREEYLKLVDNVGTMMSLAYIRFTLNSKDEFYLAEQEYCDEKAPLLDLAMNECNKAIVESPFRIELEKRMNPLILKSMELSLKTISPEIIEDLQEEGKLITEYSKFMSEMLFDFHGEKMPLTFLKKFMASSDREERKDAFEAAGKGLKESEEFFDQIYDKLVKIRDKMAKKLGFENYVKLGYLKNSKYFYDKNDVAKFRKNVEESIVPVVSKLKSKIAKNLGIDKMMFYDNATYFADTPKPVLSAEEMFKAGREMYHAMSDQTGEFIDMMIDNEAFDYESREGKWGGGYCTEIKDYKQPFILANFNGTSADVDVLTHEVGHAFNSHLNSSDPADTPCGYETLEVHSMSMEFFCWKYMDKFFGERANDYKFSHLADALTFIPYGTIIDEFQEIVYENPNLTPKERKEVYKKLEDKYTPFLSTEGMTSLEEGTRWQIQMHVFERPFYYIDYALAQCSAIQFLEKSLANYDEAFKDYLKFLKGTGKKTLQDLAVASGLNSPFEEGALEGVAKSALEILDTLN